MSFIKWPFTSVNWIAGWVRNDLNTQYNIECRTSGWLVKLHRLYIPFDIFPRRCNITLFIFFWKTALHVSGGISTHHQELTQLYLQYLVLVKPLLLPVFSVILYSFWYISNKMQHYTVHLFLENRWYLHPSSGTHTTVFTVSGTCQTVTATCP